MLGLFGLTGPFADWTRPTLFAAFQTASTVLLRWENWEERDVNSIDIAVVGLGCFLSGLKWGSNLGIVDIGRD